MCTHPHTLEQYCSLKDSTVRVAHLMASLLSFWQTGKLWNQYCLTQNYKKSKLLSSAPTPAQHHWVGWDCSLMSSESLPLWAVLISPLLRIKCMKQRILQQGRAVGSEDRSRAAALGLEVRAATCLCSAGTLASAPFEPSPHVQAEEADLRLLQLADFARGDM